MRRAFVLVTPAVVLAAAGCLATSTDVDALRTSVNDLKAQQTHSDSVQAAQLARVAADVGAVNDSVLALSARVAKMNGDVRGDLYGIGQQLIQIQELTGQSQRRLQELRASLEQRQADAGPAGAAPAGAAAAGAAGAAAGAGAGAAPGPSELLQLSLDQLRRGSYAAARSGLGILIQQYPQSDLVPEAEFYIGEAWSKEGNAASADSAYALVVAKYPQSARAPTALYKRAVAKEAKGNKTAARAAYTQLVQSYPRSDEAALAKERLRALQ